MAHIISILLNFFQDENENREPINFNVELWKALTKSFRFTLLNIASYGFLLLPSSGLAMIAMGYSKYDEIELPFAKPDYMSKYAEVILT